MRIIKFLDLEFIIWLVEQMRTLNHVMAILITNVAFIRPIITLHYLILSRIKVLLIKLNNTLSM